MPSIDPLAVSATVSPASGDPLRRLVSIIVISRDDPKGLTATLQSIANQTFKDYEVVLVAKGCSLEIDAREWAFPDIRVKEQLTSGISAAFNEALALASGHVVSFLNGGDVYSNETVLQRMAPHLAANSAAILAARAVDRRTGVRIPRDVSFMRRNLELVSHQASFFRRSLFDVHGTYAIDFRIRMDFEWMLRLPPQMTVHWLDETIVNFEGGGVSSMQPVRSSIEELRALRLHGRPFYRLMLLCGVYLPMRVARHGVRRIFPRLTRSDGQMGVRGASCSCKNVDHER